MRSLSRLLLTFSAFVLCVTTLPGQGKTYAATDFGGKGDGVAMNTAAIQKAIDAAAQHGGGTVTFAPGVYLTGSVFLKNGVTLNVPKGVTLTGSQHIEDYPLMPTRIAGIEMTWPSALINIYKQQHASITGEGTIDGNGRVFWEVFFALRKQDEPIGLRWAADYDAKRPRLIQVFDSSDVHIGGGLKLQRSGFWTVQICYSHDIVISGLVIDNNIDGKGPSTDAIDIDSSRKVLVEKIDVTNNDDALCLKAGRDADGLRVNRPTQDIVIRDSIIRRAAAGVTFGSETSGGFRNIEVYNLRVLSGVPNGIFFKSAQTRGGFAENIRIHDITLEGVPTVFRMTMNWYPQYSYAKIPAGMKNVPPYYATLSQPVPIEKGIERVSNVRIWNIHATGARTAFDVEGYPTAPPSDFVLEHWTVEARTAGHVDHVADWKFVDVHVAAADGSKLGIANSANVTGIDTVPFAPSK